jgi:hypothetical protein
MKESVYDTLELLLKSNKQLFVVTNKPLLPTRTILDKFGMNCFRDINTPDSHADMTMSKAEMISFLLDRWGIEKICPDGGLYGGGRPRGMGKWHLSGCDAERLR